MKNIKAILGYAIVALLVVFAVVFMFYSPVVANATEQEVSGAEQQTSTTKQQTNETGYSYNEYNSIVVEVEVTEKTVFTPAQFPEVNCKEVLVAGMNKTDAGYYYELVLVLNDGEDLRSAEEAVAENPIVSRVPFNKYVTYNSYMHLSESSIVLEVGETAEIQIADVKLGHNDDVPVHFYISLDYDVYGGENLHSDYFAEYGIHRLSILLYPEFSGTNKYDCSGYLESTTRMPPEAYVAVVNKFAQVEGIEEIGIAYSFEPGGVQPQESWSVEDDTIVSVNLSSGLSLDKWQTTLNQTATVTALKAGKTTVSASRIGDSAFTSASCVVEVVDPDFTIEDGKLIRYNGTDEIVEVPNTVTVIGERAFAGNTSIKSVIVPEGVTRIDRYAFQNCTNLSEIELPDSLTRIEYAVFDNCISLEHLTLPIGIKEMRTCIFATADYNIADGTVVFGNCGIKELKALSPSFNILIEPWDMPRWTLCLTKLETAYGYEGALGLQTVAEENGATFIPFEENLKNDAVNYSNVPQYLGDVNEDYQVTAKDALAILRYVVQLEDISAKNKADVDGENGIDAVDALEVLRCVVNLREKEIVKSNAYETHQFSLKGKYFLTDPEPVNEVKIIQSKAELDEYLQHVKETIADKYWEEDFKTVEDYFNSMDDTYFQENVCVVTFDVGKLKWGKYSVDMLFNLDAWENGEKVLKRKLTMNYEPGTDTPIEDVPDDVAYILLSGTTIPRERLNGAMLESVEISAVEK